MSAIPRGLYELLITELLNGRLTSEVLEGEPTVVELRSAEAADRFALHVAAIVERAVGALPERERVATGARLTRLLIELIASHSTGDGIDGERPVEPPRLLQAIRRRRPDGSPESLASPLIPLLDTTLLTNAPGEPRVGHQLETEIASADRIDIVMAFIRRSGIVPFCEPLRRHVDAGRSVRILTTTYTGSTEPEAIELLLEVGVEVKVSYDTSSTRLHAKSWLFHRESGFSTAYVGSSNLTHSAQVSGMEWNVRVSGVRNPTVIDKISAVFESYWQQPDFEGYDRGRFAAATRPDRPGAGAVSISPIEVRLEPFQERLLEQVALSRQRGYHRNLLVSATGTGKTVMAAVDYARLRATLPRTRLLFVAHQDQILQQSRATFAQVLRDGNFGEFWVGGQRPREFDHVFASIQSLNAAGLADLEPTHFDVIIVDEFHHAAAVTYARLLELVQPRELLGLTATPERSDGEPILQWFGGRIAAELRLWDAIDQHRLSPFAYFGIADELDLRAIPWRRGAGYDADGLTRLITGTDIWARKVVEECRRHLGAVDRIRALGFCVSVEHARYMARVFTECGVRAVAVSAQMPEGARREALTGLANSEINVIFSVDLFNEGVDVPTVDALLMLRPTESPLLFLQQLGRGLRKSPGKTLCTVLDFVGQHRREFRYDRRFQALLGGSRASVIRQIEERFPFLPAGCHMELDQRATERVLASIRNAVPDRWPQRVAELRALAAETPALTLAGFLQASGLELSDIYSNNHSWSELRDAAGLPSAPAGVHEETLRRACGRLLHVDDTERLERWADFLRARTPPDVEGLPERDRRLITMLMAQMLAQVADNAMTQTQGVELLWSHPQVRRELTELFEVLTDRIAHVSESLADMPDVPLRSPARYTRHEMLAACGDTRRIKTRTWREGVLYIQEQKTDLFAFTLDKTSGQFSPTTRYRDYAINRELIHWESQSLTGADSRTGRRYQTHEQTGNRIFLFARLTSEERAFYFLGPATYVSHKGEFPMAITWRLRHPLAGDLFAAFAAAVA